VTKIYRLTPAAQGDIRDIWCYIAQDNPPAADMVETALHDAFGLLVERPFMGSKRDDVTEKHVRFWGVYSYHIIYDPESSPLVVLRILNASRDINSLLKDEI